MMKQLFIVSVSRTGYFLGTQEQELQVSRCLISVEMQSLPRCENALIKQSEPGFVLGVYG